MKTQKGNKKTPRHGFINELAKLCGCSRHTVRTAIYDNASGAKADLVRKMYRTNYKNNNRIMKTIDCTTEFRTAENEMIQTFDNGVVLKTCFNTGVTGVFINNELKTTYQNLTIKEYVKLQQDVHDLQMI